MVVAHTISGAWRSKRTIGSRAPVTHSTRLPAPLHTPETFEDSEMFFYMIGELLFFDQDNKIPWQENHKTSIDRYMRYCADNGIAARDLTSWDA